MPKNLVLCLGGTGNARSLRNILPGLPQLDR